MGRFGDLNNQIRGGQHGFERPSVRGVSNRSDSTRGVGGLTHCERCGHYDEPSHGPEVCIELLSNEAAVLRRQRDQVANRLLELDRFATFDFDVY